MRHGRLLRIDCYISGRVLIVLAGVALLLTGIGLVILACAVFGGGRPNEVAVTPAPVPERG